MPASVAASLAGVRADSSFFITSMLQTHPADKFLHVAIVPANAYQRTIFQLSSSISFGDRTGSQNKKWELLTFQLPRSIS